MADSAASPPSRSKSSSAKSSRARAASSDDDRRPALAAVEPEPPAAQDIAREPSDASAVLQFDPRQGTLLGFELPVDALGSMSEELAPVQAEAVEQPQAGRAARGRPASTEQTDADALPQPKLLSPGAALASVRQQAGRRSTEAARSNGFAAVAEPAPAAEIARAFPVPSFAVAASPDSVTEANSGVNDSAQSAELAEAVASLQAALIEERRAAEERWRRNRHWLTLASAGLVMLLAVSVAQTIALLTISHRTQAAQQQTLSALNDQHAALSALASSTSALSERMQLPREQADLVSDAATAANPAQRQVKRTHARHLKENAKPASTR